MILYEFEGKELLRKEGITVPQSQLLNSPDEEINLRPPLVLKAQVLSGKRAEGGGIMIVNRVQGIGDSLKQLFGRKINNETVDKILIESKIEYSGPEYYVSISYDSDSRGPVLTVSRSGGTGIEERTVQTFPINPISRKVFTLTGSRFPFKKLIKLFFEQDCLLLEINPLVKVQKDGPSTSLRTKSSGFWVALDAKIKLDDAAAGRHSEWNFAPRSAPGHTSTPREIEAKKIDEGDYRGTAGSTYFDLPGGIAILASGGGASLTAMDALIKYGGKPANYTEYSGNPPKEKVAKLTQIVLSKPNLHGLFVVGAVANFTDIYETLSGFLEALRQVQPKPNYQIVIRRGGPRDQEAFEMLKKIKDFDLHLYGEETSITEAAKIMVGLTVKR